MSLWEQFVRWFRQRTCKHEWRPARWEVRSNDGYWQCNADGRYCPKCKLRNALTPAEYYAHFGHMSILR